MIKYTCLVILLLVSCFNIQADNLKKYFNEKFEGTHGPVYPKYSGDLIPYKIGEYLPIGAFKKKSNSMLYSNSIGTCYYIKHKGVEFKYGLDGDVEKKEDLLRFKIVYISTNDENFKSPFGYTMKTTLGELKKKGMRLTSNREYGYFVFLPSGWYAGFYVEEDGEMDDKVTIGSFFI